MIIDVLVVLVLIVAVIIGYQKGVIQPLMAEIFFFGTLLLIFRFHDPYTAAVDKYLHLKAVFAVFIALILAVVMGAIGGAVGGAAAAPAPPRSTRRDSSPRRSRAIGRARTVGTADSAECLGRTFRCR